MRRILLLCFFVTLSGCKQDKKENAAGAGTTESSFTTDQSYDWLLGKWQRMNEEAGKATFEYWNKTRENDYAGFGFTLQNGDTIWQERMQLKKDGDAWKLFIESPEDPEPAVFEVASTEKDKFTCANPELAFPKKIQYWKTENGLKATVSNDELEIPFEFRRLEE
jgi:hypothetical protein